MCLEIGFCILVFLCKEPHSIHVDMSDAAEIAVDREAIGLAFLMVQTEDRIIIEDCAHNIIAICAGDIDLLCRITKVCEIIVFRIRKITSMKKDRACALP